MYIHTYIHITSFPGGSAVQNSPVMQEMWIRSLAQELLERRAWQPRPGVVLPGKSCGQRSLAGYSPWSRRESDTTEVTRNRKKQLDLITG